MESSGELTAHLTAGAVIVYTIEYLKSAGWFKWMTVDSTTTNRLVSAGLAFFAVAGITGTYDPMTGGTFTVPPIIVLATGAWEWAKQYVLQQVFYDVLAQKKPGVQTVHVELPSSFPMSRP